MSSPASATRRPRWLFVSAGMAFGGHEVMTLRWLAELRAQGQVDVRVLLRQDTRLHGQMPPDLLTESPPFEAAAEFDQRSSLARMQSNWRTLSAALTQEQPDLCIFPCGCLKEYVALVCQTRLLGWRVAVYTPLVDTFEDMHFRAPRLRDWLVRHAYAKVPHTWITITQQQAAYFKQWTGTPAPVLTLPNTVTSDIEALLDQPAPAARMTTEPLRVLLLGRMDAHQKGLDLLIEHLLRSPEPLRQQLHFSFIGEGPYRATLESLLQTHPELQTCVKLAPWTPTRTAMAEHDVLLLPSRFEGVPLVMLEAMAMGLPVVASDLPGTRAFLHADQLFPCGDLVRGMHLLLALRDPATRSTAVERGRKRYREGASSGAFRLAVEALTTQLLADGPGIASFNVPPGVQT